MADVISVSALNKYVRSVLESDALLFDIAISGEISNFNRNYKTGHCYFKLKDEKASVSAVMFRSDADGLSFAPENGMQVVVRGRISLYERDGAFQVYVEYMFPSGAGAVNLAFEQLKARLDKEGLFDEVNKKNLPQYPRCVGLVTSKTGAALQDILKVAHLRCPLARFLLAPASVQGQRAPQEIALAVQQLDADPDVELIIVARGGGSAEDLWVFNDESLARVVFACKTPVISAIGHEIDFTILDFVADYRAPTPSAAAERALPDIYKLMEHNLHVYTNISKNMQLLVNSWYNRYSQLLRHPALSAMPQKCMEKRRNISLVAGGVRTAAHRALKQARLRAQASAALAAGLNPYGVLARGYSLVQDEDGKLVTQAARVLPGQKVDVVLTDGTLQCAVEDITMGKRVMADE